MLKKAKTHIGVKPKRIDSCYGIKPYTQSIKPYTQVSLKTVRTLSCTTNHLMPLTIKGNNHNLGIKEGLMTIIYCYHCYHNITIPLTNFTTLICVITATQSITIPLTNFWHEAHHPASITKALHKQFYPGSEQLTSSTFQIITPNIFTVLLAQMRRRSKIHRFIGALSIIVKRWM